MTEARRAVADDRLGGGVVVRPSVFGFLASLIIVAATGGGLLARHFVFIGEQVVARGWRRSKPTQPARRAEIAHVWWTDVGRNGNCGRLLAADGRVLMTLPPFVNLRQVKKPPGQEDCGAARQALQPEAHPDGPGRAGRTAALAPRTRGVRAAVTRR